MNLRQLNYFVKVVEAGNMTRAAEQLHVAQPALGMQIRQLEEYLGVALLERHSRGVDPTAAGALLHTRAQAILKLVEETRKDVSACGREGSEAIRLGMTPTMMMLAGPELAVNVHERIPQVFLSMAEAMSHVLVESLLRGELDIVLAYDVPDLPQLERTAVYQEDLVLVTLPGTAAARPVTFAEVMEESLVLPEAGDSVRERVARTARELGFEPRIAFEVRSIPTIRSLILRGAAAGVLPLGSVLEDVQAGRLAARPIIEPPLRRTLFVATAAARGAFKNELALTGVIRESLHCLTDVLGPLAQPLPPRER